MSYSHLCYDADRSSPFRLLAQEALSSGRMAAHHPYQVLGCAKPYTSGNAFAYRILLLDDVEDVIPTEGKLIAVLSIVVVEA